MFDTQARQLVGTKTSPEAQQDQGAVAQMPHGAYGVAMPFRVGRCDIEPIRDDPQLSQLQQCGLFFDSRVECPDTFRYLPHQRSARRVGKALLRVPFAKAAKRCLSVLIESLSA